MRNISIGSDGIYYKSTLTSGRTAGVELRGSALAFSYRTDQSSWNLTERAKIWLSANSPPRLVVSIADTARLDIDSSSPHVFVDGGFAVSGTKSRKVDTKNYSDRLLYCYETPTPLFGDIGEALLDEEGICYVDIDDIFTETIAGKSEYQVFLQKEGDGDCWIKEKHARYFVIEGTPHLKVAWELKAKQRDYENIRLEMSENGLEEYATYTDPLLNVDEYIREQEELLYG